MDDSELRLLLEERFRKIKTLNDHLKSRTLTPEEEQIKSDWNWPDDDRGRQRSIMLLFNLCHMPIGSRQIRLWAYSKLEEIAKELWEPFDRTGEPQQSPLACKVIQWWCHSVVAGGVPDPKHEPGESGSKYLWRDLEIANLVHMVEQKTGCNRQTAVLTVAKGVGLSKTTINDKVKDAGSWPFEKLLRRKLGSD